MKDNMIEFNVVVKTKIEEIILLDSIDNENLTIIFNKELFFKKIDDDTLKDEKDFCLFISENKTLLNLIFENMLDNDYFFKFIKSLNDYINSYLFKVILEQCVKRNIEFKDLINATNINNRSYLKNGQYTEMLNIFDDNFVAITFKCFNLVETRNENNNFYVNTLPSYYYYIFKYFNNNDFYYSDIFKKSLELLYDNDLSKYANMILNETIIKYSDVENDSEYKFDRENFKKSFLRYLIDEIFIKNLKCDGRKFRKLVKTLKYYFDYENEDIDYLRKDNKKIYKLLEKRGN